MTCDIVGLRGTVRDFHGSRSIPLSCFFFLKSIGGRWRSDAVGFRGASRQSSRVSQFQPRNGIATLPTLTKVAEDLWIVFRLDIQPSRLQLTSQSALHELDIQRASPSAQSQRAAWTLACFRSFTSLLKISLSARSVDCCCFIARSASFCSLASWF